MAVENGVPQEGKLSTAQHDQRSYNGAVHCVLRKTTVSAAQVTLNAIANTSSQLEDKEKNSYIIRNNYCWCHPHHARVFFDLQFFTMMMLEVLVQTISMVRFIMAQSADKLLSRMPAVDVGIQTMLLYRS